MWPAFQEVEPLKPCSIMLLEQASTHRERGKQTQGERERASQTSTREIILKLQSPVAHLVFPRRHLGFSLLRFLCLYLAEVDGTLVQGGGNLPRLCSVVRTTEHLCQHATPSDEVC